jgi:hypothetical protein
MPTSPELDQRITSLAARVKRDRGIIGHRDHEPTSARPEVVDYDVDQLKDQLRDLQTRFDPEYTHSRDHSHFTRQQAIASAIQRIKEKLRAAGESTSMEDQIAALNPRTTKRIAEEIFTITDIIEGKIGSVCDQDRKRLLDCVVESVVDGFDINDAVISLESYIQEAYISGTSTNFGTPSQPPAPGAAVQPAPGAQTSTAVKPVTPAANVSIGGAAVMNPDKFKQDIVNKLKTDPEASKTFAEILAKLMVKK